MHHMKSKRFKKEIASRSGEIKGEQLMMKLPLIRLQQKEKKRESRGFSQ